MGKLCKAGYWSTRFAAWRARIQGTLVSGTDKRRLSLSSIFPIFRFTCFYALVNRFKGNLDLVVVSFLVAFGRVTWHVSFLPRFIDVLVKSSRTTKHGKGKDPHQHRCHRPRRLRKVDHHWPSHLQMWRYRQKNDRKIWERSARGKLMKWKFRPLKLLP